MYILLQKLSIGIIFSQYVVYITVIADFIYLFRYIECDRNLDTGSALEALFCFLSLYVYSLFG